MVNETEVIFAFIVIGVIIIAILLLFFKAFGEWFLEYNMPKEKSIKKGSYREIYDDAIITQSKNHHREHQNKIVKKEAKVIDFDVNFDVSLQNTIVKTEVVYAE